MLLPYLDNITYMSTSSLPSSSCWYGVTRDILHPLGAEREIKNVFESVSSYVTMTPEMDPNKSPKGRTEDEIIAKYSVLTSH